MVLGTVPEGFEESKGGDITQVFQEVLLGRRNH